MKNSRYTPEYNDSLIDYVEQAKDRLDRTDSKKDSEASENLNDIIEFLEDFNDPSYCITCGSCGISECCQPLCMYGDEHKKDYKKLIKELDDYYQLYYNIKDILNADSAAKERQIQAIKDAINYIEKED